ncbi:hypothetical protein C7H84_03065 [Burkholderia sp. Nafp2/4-1b]|uniref:hypothetical protein n=1 Tax=Burkholderia sp. Nafp2/4-1b TaxID=2116686 RepID=UPI000EF91F64|nr:hypothetical protein [Burkholderia sp. Nafp2/4-1b]RKU05137.1 hypothetical protein C7H84_03065 [Burkholderia sp. Nafp2/4-1b]
MTRRLNRNIANDAGTTILRELAQSVGASETQVLNAFAFACIAPALASNTALRGAAETGSHAAGVAGAAGAVRAA